MIRPPRSGRTSISHRAAAILIVAILATACGGHSTQAQQQQRGQPAVASTPPASAEPTTAPAPVADSHIFVVVMENRSYDQALAAPYTASLARRYGVATNYHGVSHPSLPNYLAITSGSTWGIADDGYHTLPLTGLGEQLTNAGISWRAYMEGMSGTCLSSPYPYALKHDPFGYYGGRCPAQVVPFTSFGGDLAGANMPRFVWITPGLCNDGHDCSTGVSDHYLSQLVPEILNSSAWQDNGVLFITWDEGEDAYNHVLTLVLRPGGTATSSSVYHDHYSLLATIEDRFGLPRLGQAAHVSSLRELLVSGSAASS